MNPVAASRIRRVREALPADAFKPNPRRLWMVAAHTAVVLACYWWIRAWPATALFAAVIIGHSLACLGFIAHEVSHNAVVRNRAVRYAVLLWTFGLNFVAPTMWNRLHNDAHHGNAGTPGDPDRPFLAHEKNRATVWYSTLFYPSESSWKTMLVFCHFISYLLRNMAAVFYPANRKPAVVSSKPSYQDRERWWTAAEIIWMLGLQYVVWLAAGSTWWGFLWASLVPLCITSSIAMTYVFTQHFLNPIEHETDPIAGTTSLVVPRWVDWLHCNFSFHTEHHVFPTMNSSYYPLVSRALQEEAGSEYRRIGARAAWRQLWKTGMFRKVSESPLTSSEP
ncbi:MAG TPA: fatty acid desaturase [Vicinamibacterales bacterium]|nr:fatty acid desaturase [Vicinamibacterales bacterium]